MSLKNFLLTSLFCTAAASFGFATTANAQCTNSCSTSNDNECDDGGPGSLYSICDLGTDCNDCGPRTGGAMVCNNTCSTSSDSECDDGGPGSLYSICTYGSDCNDCGPRPAQAGATGQAAAPNSAAPGSMCNNTCPSSNDNECDDGGPNSLYSICDLGTDCADCGMRQIAQTCTNTCSTSNDNECDDGGPGSLYSICDLGTDCNDCGPRN